MPESYIEKRRRWLTPPRKLSYSAWKNLIECPRKFEMTNVMYWTPKTADNRAFMLGSVAHSCLERWVKEGKFAREFMSSVVNAEYNKYLQENTVIFINEKDKQELLLRARNAVVLLEHTIFVLKLHEGESESEQLWAVDLPKAPGVKLTGKIDLLKPLLSCQIWDLKMTENVQYLDTNQLKFYGLMGALKGRKTKEAALLTPLRPDLYMPVEFTAQDYRELYDEIMLTLRQLIAYFREGSFPMVYDKSRCYRCQVNQFCSEWKRDNTVIDRPVTDGVSGKRIIL